MSVDEYGHTAVVIAISVILFGISKAVQYTFLAFLWMAEFNCSIAYVSNYQTPCVQVFKSLVRGQPPSDDVIPNSVYLHTYIIYLRQTYTVERNLLMIEALQSSKTGDGKKNRPQDFARLYEIIVQVSCGSRMHCYVYPIMVTL